jgi:hypothetical protein
MHYLSDGPAAGAVLGIQLLFSKAEYGIAHFAGKGFDIIYPAIYGVLRIRNGCFKLAGGIS